LAGALHQTPLEELTALSQCPRTILGGFKGPTCKGKLGEERRDREEREREKKN